MSWLNEVMNKEKREKARFNHSERREYSERNVSVQGESTLVETFL